MTLCFLAAKGFCKNDAATCFLATKDAVWSHCQHPSNQRQEGEMANLKWRPPPALLRIIDLADEKCSDIYTNNKIMYFLSLFPPKFETNVGTHDPV